jgi:hypothetical protein
VGSGHRGRASIPDILDGIRVDGLTIE